MKISTNLKKFRTAQGLTQDQLAEKLHVTRQTVSSWERSASNPNLEQLEAIAAALEVDVMVLLYGPQPAYRPSRRQVVTAAGLVLALLVLWIVSWRLGPWARMQTGQQLTYHFYWFNNYYLLLMAVIGGLAAAGVAGLRWALTLEPRGRRLCLGVGLALLAVLVLVPLLFVVTGRYQGEVPWWISRFFGFWMEWGYRRTLWVVLGILAGGLLYLGGNRLPEKGEEAQR